jgi:hypothetical protein
MQFTAAARAMVDIAPLTGSALASPSATDERAADGGHRGHGRCCAPLPCPRPFPPGKLLAPLAPDQLGCQLVSHQFPRPTRSACNHPLMWSVRAGIVVHLEHSA